MSPVRNVTHVSGLDTFYVWRSGSPSNHLPNAFGCILITRIKPTHFGQCDNRTVRMCSVAFP